MNAVNASVTIVNSTFFDPMPWNGSTYIRAWAGGQVLLSGCEFAEATDLRFSPFQAYDGATIFSDDTDIEVRSDGPPLDTLEPSPLVAIPTGPTAPNRVFLQRSDPWFANIRSVSPHLLSCTVLGATQRSSRAPAPVHCVEPRLRFQTALHSQRTLCTTALRKRTNTLGEAR